MGTIDVVVFAQNVKEEKAKVTVTLTFDLEKNRCHVKIRNVQNYHHTKNCDNPFSRFPTIREKRNGQGSRDLDL